MDAVRGACRRSPGGRLTLRMRAKGGRLIYVGVGHQYGWGFDAAECPPNSMSIPGWCHSAWLGGRRRWRRRLKQMKTRANWADARWRSGSPAERCDRGNRGQRTHPVYHRGGRACQKQRRENDFRHSQSRLASATSGASAIVTEVGPEVISGSTRMKAGTAQKMVLNMLSSGAMTRLGYVYGNLMVNVTPRNSKLAARGVSILQQAASVSSDVASKALRSAGNSVPVALVMPHCAGDRHEAETL